MGGIGDLTVKVGTVVGATDGWWSQVHHFTQLEEAKLVARGEMVVAIAFSLPAASGVDMVTVGREVLGRINEEYYGVLEGPAWERLTEAIQKVAKESLERSREEISTEDGNSGEAEAVEITGLSVVAGVLMGDVWYLGGWGEGEMWVRREGQMGQVFFGKGEFWGGSGRVHEGDLVLFGTGRFFEETGQGVVRAALTTGSVEEAVGVLAPVVGGKRRGEGAAAAVVGFEGESKFSAVSNLDVGEEVTVSTVVEKGIGRKLTERLSGKLVGILGKFKGRGIYVRSYRPPGPGKKGTFVIGIILLVILLGSIIVGVRVRREREIAVGPIGQAQERIDQAKGLVGISSDRARSLLSEAKVLAMSVQDKKAQGELLGQIESLSDQALGVVRVSPTTFLDLKLVRDSLSATDSFWADGVWWGLDAQSFRVVSVDTANKQANVVAGKDQVGSGRLVAATGGKVYVLNEKGIVEIDPKTSKVRTVVEADSDWVNIVDLSSFGGNLYVLDAGSSLIWRYPAIEGGFGGKQRWFGSGVTPNLGQAVSMTLDGSLWVGLKDGTILKFTQGAADPFAMPDLDRPVGELGEVFTTADLANLYLLDRGLGRVIVVSKKGEYMGQYVSSAYIGTRGISVVDSDGKEILVSAGEKILEAED